MADLDTIDPCLLKAFTDGVSTVSWDIQRLITSIENWLIDDGPVYHAVSVHLCRVKSIIRICIDGRYAMAKFSKSVVLDKKFKRKYPYFLRYPNLHIV